MRLKCASIGLLLGASLLLAACSGVGQAKDPSFSSRATVTVESVTESTEVTPTTVITEDKSSPVESTTTTTLPPFVDLPDPVRMFSDDLGGDADVLTREICENGKCSPPAGTVVFKRLDLNGAAPGEIGLAYVIAHVNRGELFFNLIDDNENVYRDDKGLQVGDAVSFELDGGTICTYGVIPPLLDESTENVFSVPDQPAVYWNKDPNARIKPLNAMLNLDEIKGRAILMMAVSYAGPDGDQFRTKGHRLNNGVVMAELISCNSP